MLYSFARVSAVLGMRRQDYFGQGSRGWLRLHEKGGKRHDVPAHHRVAATLDAYVEAGGLEEPKVALFQTVDLASRRLTGRALDRRLVLAMIKRRAAAAGLPASTCCHTFRATGVTAYLSNGGTLERAQQIGRARVSEDDEALRPDGGHGDGRRDRAHRDLKPPGEDPSWGDGDWLSQPSRNLQGFPSSLRRALCAGTRFNDFALEVLPARMGVQTRLPSRSSRVRSNSRWGRTSGRLRARPRRGPDGELTRPGTRERGDAEDRGESAPSEEEPAARPGAAGEPGSRAGDRAERGALAPASAARLATRRGGQ